MRHLIRSEGLEEYFELDSAGTHDYHVGDAPDPRSIRMAATLDGGEAKVKAGRFLFRRLGKNALCGIGLSPQSRSRA